MSNGYVAKCMAIAQSCFLNTLYKDVPAFDLYAGDGFANKAYGICHYCTADT